MRQLCGANVALIGLSCIYCCYIDLVEQGWRSVMPIGRRRDGLISARKVAGFTQEGLADVLHVDRSTVARLETREQVYASAATLTRSRPNPPRSVIAAALADYYAPATSDHRPYTARCGPGGGDHQRPYAASVAGSRLLADGHWRADRIRGWRCAATGGG